MIPESSRTTRCRNRTKAARHAALFVVMSGLHLACDAQAASANNVTRIGFIGASHPAGESAARGALLGAEEAERTGALLGRRFELLAATANTPDDAAQHAARLIDEGVTAIVGGFDDTTCTLLDSLARARGVVFVNIGCRSDALRTTASVRTFHVEASDSMYTRALRRAVEAGGAAPVLWHAQLSRYGAAQLNQRFVRRFAIGADGNAWAAWMAMKLLWESSASGVAHDRTALARYLLDKHTEFDGHKGEALRFDSVSRQLRQPLLDAPRASRGGAASHALMPVVDSVSDTERDALQHAFARRVPRLVVTNEGSSDVMVLNAETGEVLATIRFAERPRGVQTIGEGRWAWIALSDEAPTEQGDGDAIAELDLQNGRVLARHAAGSDPEQFAIADDGSLLVASNEDAGTATLIAPHASTTTHSLVVGIEPEGVALSPDARWAYVTAETSNTVSVIDIRAVKVVASFLVDERPRAAAFAPNGKRAYVTNEISGTLSVIDASTHQVQATVMLAAGRARPVGVVVSPDSERVYVANGHANSVSVVDAASLEESRVIHVGRRPWGLALSADGSRLYVANGGSNDVSVIDTRTYAITATFPVGERPWGVAVTR